MPWLDRLKSGLNKSSSNIGGGISAIFSKRKIDGETLAELEELLIAADLGPSVAGEIIESFSKSRFGKEATPQEIKSELVSQIAQILKPVARKLEIDKNFKPHVILVAGVNGNGKTTAIGKMAAGFKSQGHKVMMAACDTFRAAAGSQLSIWAERTGCPLVGGAEGADPASIAFQALEQARRENYDVLLIDTAGRLQNKTGLMEELAKIIRVLKKLDPGTPHNTLLVLDATTGQNAISQVEIFKNIADINGLIITKLDGTAKGGIVVALTKKFGLPVYAIGIGEGIEDLQGFNPDDFAHGLVGL